MHLEKCFKHVVISTAIKEGIGLWLKKTRKKKGRRRGNWENAMWTTDAKHYCQLDISKSNIIKCYKTLFTCLDWYTLLVHFLTA